MRIAGRRQGLSDSRVDETWQVEPAFPTRRVLMSHAWSPRIPRLRLFGFPNLAARLDKSKSLHVCWKMVIESVVESLEWESKDVLRRMYRSQISEDLVLGLTLFHPFEAIRSERLEIVTEVRALYRT